MKYALMLDDAPVLAKIDVVPDTSRKLKERSRIQLKIKTVNGMKQEIFMMILLQSFVTSFSLMLSKERKHIIYLSCVNFTVRVYRRGVEPMVMVLPTSLIGCRRS